MLDGNGRLARLRGLATALAGHARGAGKPDEALIGCELAGVRAVRPWGFRVDDIRRVSNIGAAFGGREEIPDAFRARRCGLGTRGVRAAKERA